MLNLLFHLLYAFGQTLIDAKCEIWPSGHTEYNIKYEIIKNTILLIFSDTWNLCFFGKTFQCFPNYFSSIWGNYYSTYKCGNIFKYLIGLLLSLNFRPLPVCRETGFRKQISSKDLGRKIYLWELHGQYLLLKICAIAVAQRICLSLPSCSPMFETQALQLCFLVTNIVLVIELKKDKKRPGLWICEFLQYLSQEICLRHWKTLLSKPRCLFVSYI